MSQTIWTRCAAEPGLRRLRCRVWRVVEGQHVIATRKLVDSLAEHEVLERLIDGVKPPMPDEPAFVGQHYLLATPFRYPPLQYGSRFGGRFEGGVWYGSMSTPTALAESAFYRLLLLDGSRGEFGVISSEHSAFRVRLESGRGFDLGWVDLAEMQPLLSRDDYHQSQAFGRELRAAGGEVLRFPSVRDPNGGVNVAVFTPVVFRDRRPDLVEGWSASSDRQSVVFHRVDVHGATRLEFARADFTDGDRLPHPSLSTG